MMLGKMELQSTAYGMDNTLSPIDEDINVFECKCGSKKCKKIKGIKSDIFIK